MCRRIDARISGQERLRIGKGKDMLMNEEISNDTDKYVAEVCIRPSSYRTSTTSQSTSATSFDEDLRVALLGPSNAGKSTLLGVLVEDQLDNGRGGARVNLLRHRHEVLSGQTSSVSTEYLVFGRCDSTLVWQRQDFSSSSSSPPHRVIQFYDLAGDLRYLRSTWTALSSPAGPNLALLVYNPKHLGQSKEDSSQELSLAAQAKLCEILGIPFAVVIQKIDLVAEDNWHEMVFSCLKDTVPVFPVSAVTGKGLKELLHFLGNTAFSAAKRHESLGGFFIERIQALPDLPDCAILKGRVMDPEMVVQVGKTYWIGNEKVQVHSIHRMRTAVSSALPGQFAAVAVTVNAHNMNCHNRQGMIMQREISENGNSFTILEFDAELLNLEDDAKEEEFGDSSCIHGTVCVGALRASCRLQRTLVTNCYHISLVSAIPSVLGCKVLFFSDHKDYRMVGHVLRITL